MMALPPQQVTLCCCATSGWVGVLKPCVCGGGNYCTAPVHRSRYLCALLMGVYGHHDGIVAT